MGKVQFLENDLSESLEGEVLEESEYGLPPHQEERRLP